jgi:hypothetical protein
MVTKWSPNGHQMVTNSHQMVTNSHQMVTNSHQMVTNSHQMVTNSHQMVTSPAGFRASAQATFLHAGSGWSALWRGRTWQRWLLCALCFVRTTQLQLQQSKSQGTACHLGAASAPSAPAACAHSSDQPVPLLWRCSANPVSINNAISSSKAKLIQHGWGILAVLAAAGAVLLLGRGRLFGRRRRGGDDEDGGGGRGGGSGHWGGSSVVPMAAEKQRAERLAVRCVCCGAAGPCLSGSVAGRRDGSAGWLTARAASSIPLLCIYSYPPHHHHHHHHPPPTDPARM